MGGKKRKQIVVASSEESETFFFVQSFKTTKAKNTFEVKKYFNSIIQLLASKELFKKCQFVLLTVQKRIN